MSSPRRAGLLARLAVVFLAAWALRSLIVTGGAVLNEPFRSVLATPPWSTQRTSGNGFEMSLLQINASIPASDRVLVAWIDPPNYSYVFFYATYWLYPRKVTVVTSLEPAALTAADILVDIRLPAEPEPTIEGYQRVKVYGYSDHVVTVFGHAG